MYNAQFAQMISELLGNPVFAEVSTRYEVTIFDAETGEQKYGRGFDCMEAADTYALQITRHEELCARLTSSADLIVYLYDAGECSSYFVEVQA